MLSAAVAGALLCAIAAASVAAPSGAANVTAACQAAQLRGHEFGSTGAMGTITLSITLRNVGATCSMKGYTALRLRDSAGLVSTRVTHGGLAVLTATPKRVVLSSGKSATVLVAYSDVPRGSETCIDATALVVQPPGQTGWRTVSLPLPNAEVCNHGAVRESPILIGVVRAG
jgi:hypothetical protein